MLLMAPLAFVPMLCVMFYGLGGGRGGAGGPVAGEMKGLNMALPQAQLNGAGQPKDKLGFYEKARTDSLRLRERRRRDPYAARDSVWGVDSVMRQIGRAHV